MEGNSHFKMLYLLVSLKHFSYPRFDSGIEPLPNQLRSVETFKPRFHKRRKHKRKHKSFTSSENGCDASASTRQKNKTLTNSKSSLRGEYGSQCAQMSTHAIRKQEDKTFLDERHFQGKQESTGLQQPR